MQNRKYKVMYILGSGHCGSTLLGLLLGSHSQIMSLGEVHNINEDDVLCTCGARPSDGVFWGDIVKALPSHSIKIHKKKQDFLFDKGDAYYMETGDSVSEEKYRNTYKKIYKKALEKSGKRIIASSASPERVDILSRDDEMEPIVVHLVRDGRAVTWSYLKKGRDFFSAAMRWFGTNIKIELVKRRTPYAQHVFIRYEDLVENTEKMLLVHE